MSSVSFYPNTVAEWKTPRFHGAVTAQEVSEFKELWSRVQEERALRSGMVIADRRWCKLSEYYQDSLCKHKMVQAISLNCFREEARSAPFSESGREEKIARFLGIDLEELDEVLRKIILDYPLGVKRLLSFVAEEANEEKIRKIYSLCSGEKVLLTLLQGASSVEKCCKKVRSLEQVAHAAKLGLPPYELLQNIQFWRRCAQSLDKPVYLQFKSRFTDDQLYLIHPSSRETILEESEQCIELLNWMQPEKAIRLSNLLYPYFFAQTQLDRFNEPSEVEMTFLNASVGYTIGQRSFIVELAKFLGPHHLQLCTYQPKELETLFRFIHALMLYCARHEGLSQEVLLRLLTNRENLPLFAHRDTFCECLEMGFALEEISLALVTAGSDVKILRKAGWTLEAIRTYIESPLYEREKYPGCMPIEVRASLNEASSSDSVNRLDERYRLEVTELYPDIPATVSVLLRDANVSTEELAELEPHQRVRLLKDIDLHLLLRQRGHRLVDAVERNRFQGFSYEDSTVAMALLEWSDEKILDLGGEPVCENVSLAQVRRFTRSMSWAEYLEALPTYFFGHFSVGLTLMLAARYGQSLKEKVHANQLLGAFGDVAAAELLLDSGLSLPAVLELCKQFNLTTCLEHKEKLRILEQRGIKVAKVFDPDSFDEVYERARNGDRFGGRVPARRAPWLIDIFCSAVEKISLSLGWWLRRQWHLWTA